MMNAANDAAVSHMPLCLDSVEVNFLPLACEGGRKFSQRPERRIRSAETVRLC